jgi:hypothetical protein
MAHRKNIGLTARQTKFVALKVRGLGDVAAARAAGYTEATALQGEVARCPRVQAAFADLLDRACPDPLLVQRLREGVDAQDGKRADLGQRRQYLELALRAKGRIAREPVEVIGRITIVPDL